MNVRKLTICLVVLGLFVLINSANAAIKKVEPSVINVGESADITIELDRNETTVRLIDDGCGISDVSDYSDNETTVTFSGIVALKTGYIKVYANDSSGDTDTAWIYCASTRRSRRHMDVTYTPAEPVTNEVIIITVLDSRTDDPVEEAEIDIFLNGNKVAYGLTNESGQFTFTPTTAGDYSVTIDRRNYYQEEIVIPVTAGVTTTTVETTVETTIPTTVETTVETTTPPETTTPSGGGIGGGTILLIIVGIIVIVVVIFVVTKGKGTSGEGGETTK